MRFGDPRRYRIGITQVEQIAFDAPGRSRILFVVLTVGATLWISPAKDVRVGQGIPIPAINGIAYLIDECPEPHEGEWYAISDNANTDIIVIEG